MADCYRENRDSQKMLICWNTVNAMVAIAKNFGFRVVSKGKFCVLYYGANVNLLFKKR